MRDFSKVSPLLYRSHRYRSLGDDAKLLFHYLLTSEHQNSAGAYRLPTGYALVDMDWDAERYEPAMQELVQVDMIARDMATDEVRICRWFKHNPPMNPSHRKGIASLLTKLESNELREQAIAELQQVEMEKFTGPGKQPSGFHNGDLTKTRFFSGTQ